MEQIIAGIRYDTDKASEIANDRYWDGHNFERNGRNTYLFRSPKGRFFALTESLWQGERDYIEPLTATEAKALYERLPEKLATYEEAFGESPEEA